MCSRSVGIGSDFDGIGSTPDGLEDVSKYPALVCSVRCLLDFPVLTPLRTDSRARLTRLEQI
jgi:hypothetical protein